MLRPYLHVAILSMTMACVTRTVTPGSVNAVTPRTTSSSGTDEVQAVVQLALTLDAAGDARADTLYTPDAVVIGNARMRVAAPRFAGIVTGNGGGHVQVAAANATVEGRMAWVLVDYRWTNPAERRVEAGRATIILERQSKGGWKIVHAHSSQPLPWEP